MSARGPFLRLRTLGHDQLSISSRLKRQCPPIRNVKNLIALQHPMNRRARADSPRLLAESSEFLTPRSPRRHGAFFISDRPLHPAHAGISLIYPSQRSRATVFSRASAATQLEASTKVYRRLQTDSPNLSPRHDAPVSSAKRLRRDTARARTSRLRTPWCRCDCESELKMEIPGKGSQPLGDVLARRV
jgi:hypothetical protein